MEALVQHLMIHICLVHDNVRVVRCSHWKGKHMKRRNWTQHQLQSIVCTHLMELTSSICVTKPAAFLTVLSLSLNSLKC